MMYNLTYLGHQVTLSWLDLRSNFDLDLSRSNYTWFDAPWRDKLDGIKIVALPLQLKILSSENRFWKILEFWPLVTSILTWGQKWPKWFRNDFSRAFERRFPFCSTMRRSRDRRGGGCSNTPPAGGGKSRGPSGRGLIKRTIRFPVTMAFVQEVHHRVHHIGLQHGVRARSALGGNVAANRGA